LNVGSMATIWAGDITPAARRRVTRLDSTSTTLLKGAEMGRFNMGSTVILLFEPGRIRLQADIAANRAVKLGERVATLMP
jgi:phosphatidylserine decarboxylase